MTTMKLSQPADMPAPPNTFPDFDWIRDNEAALLEKYGEGFVIVYEKQVLGFGYTFDEAEKNAQANLPPGDNVIYPVIDTIYKRRVSPYFLSSRLTISLDELTSHDDTD